MHIVFTKSATLIVFDSLIKLKGTHFYVTSFHLISKFHPTVLLRRLCFPRLVVLYPSALEIDQSSHLTLGGIVIIISVCRLL